MADSPRDPNERAHPGAPERDAARSDAPPRPAQPGRARSNGGRPRTSSRPARGAGSGAGAARTTNRRPSQQAGGRRGSGAANHARGPGAGERGRGGAGGPVRGGGGRSSAPPASPAPRGETYGADRVRGTDDEVRVRAADRRATLIGVVGALVPAVVLAVVLGATVGPVAGVVALVVVAVTGALYVRRRCVARALAILGAAPCHPDRHPRLYNVTEGLCATFGLRMPELWVVDDPAINACALGRAGGEATLVFTTGVLTRLDLDQLEGLVAHELAHVKRHDAVVGAAAIVVLWPLSRLTRRDGYLHAMVGQGREYLADQLAAATIRYPSGLRDALVAMTGGPPPAPSSVLEPPRLATTRWIWADPDPGAGPATRADMGGSLDTLAVRAAALAEW